MESKTITHRNPNIGGVPGAQAPVRLPTLRRTPGISLGGLADFLFSVVYWRQAARLRLIQHRSRTPPARRTRAQLD